jgi:hypothetical protein
MSGRICVMYRFHAGRSLFMYIPVWTPWASLPGLRRNWRGTVSAPNCVSAYYHDHLFVPTAQGEPAVGVLRELQRLAGIPDPD